MTNATISNNAEKDLKSNILWQYDKSANLVALIGMLSSYFGVSTTEIWDKLSSEACLASFDSSGEEQTPSSVSDFALAVIGKLIGVPRPTLVYGTGDERQMSSELYRRILVARMRLSCTNAGISDYISFVKYVFDGNVSITGGEDMSIGFSWNDEADTTDELVAEQKLAFEQCLGSIVEYPAGVKSSAKSSSRILGFDGQAKASSTDPEIDTMDNSSFNWN